jgi:hypothetical protein
MASNRPCPNCEKDYKAIPKIRDFNITSKMRSNDFSFETVAELLKTSESELQEYDEEIKRMKARIYVLEGRKKKLEGYIVSMRRLLSPIRKLPLDVLGSIFEAANSAAVIGSGGSSSVPARLFTGVCSYWRNLALGMPSLWSDIELNADFEREQWQTNVLTTLLMLSQASPLTLRIKCERDMYNRHVRDSQRRHTAIDKLLQESSRWQEVVFNCPYAFLVASFANFRGEFQDLRCLDVFDIPVTSSARSSSLSVFGTAPRLSQLALTYLEQWLSIAVPYGQITHATLAWLGLDDVVEILRRCTNLICIQIFWVPLLSEPRTVIQPLSASFQSNIQDLTISIWGTNDLTLVEEFISCATLPLLDNLKIDTRILERPQVSPWGIIIDAFQGLLSRSQCHITKLTIRDSAIDSIHFLSLLSCLSQLEELNLHNHSDTRQILSDAVVSELRADKASTLLEAVLLPRLRKINFTIASSDLSDGVLLDMVTSRSDPFYHGGDSNFVRLKAVRVRAKGRRIKKDIIESYGHLVTMGLSVTLIDKRGTLIP